MPFRYGGQGDAKPSTCVVTHTNSIAFKDHSYVPYEDLSHGPCYGFVTKRCSVSAQQPVRVCTPSWYSVWKRREDLGVSAWGSSSHTPIYRLPTPRSGSVARIGSHARVDACYCIPAVIHQSIVSTVLVYLFASSCSLPRCNSRGSCFIGS